MREELFDFIIEEANVLSPVDSIEIFIQECKSNPQFRIAFDKTDHEKESCVNLINDSSYYSGGSWALYHFCIFSSIKIEIEEGDACVPLTDEQKEVFLDSLQMMLL